MALTEHRLEAKGLLARHRTEHDRRSIDIELTTKGLALVPKLIPISQTINQRFIQNLTELE